MPSIFGVLPGDVSVSLWILSNAQGARVRLIDYGAAIVSVEVPDGRGRLADVVLGYDTLEAYRTRRGCLGAVVGRYANRINRGQFSLDGVGYQLALRGGIHALHGGPEGFDKQAWRGTWVEQGRSVRFAYRSVAGEGGFPGTCDVEVSYRLTDDNTLAVAYAATTDAPTPINLSQHVYFNLAGHDAGDIGAHELQLEADHFTPVDDSLVPTGEVRSVEGTPFDFRRARAIGSRIDMPDPQLQVAGGYDHNYVLRSAKDEGLTAARVVEPTSGRTLVVETSEPGVQFYTGNSLDGSQVGKSGRPYGRRAGFCLETQHFPDSPNHAAFPDTILRPGVTFRSETRFRFGVA